MQERGFVSYIVIIAIILAVVFLSQNPEILGKGKTFTFINDTAGQVKAYLAKGSNWVRDKVFPSLSGEVQKRGEMVKEGVEQQKEKISENISEKIKNYFSGITDAILHPGEKENNNCDCQIQPSSQ